MQVKKQQLELDMEQQTGSKSGKEYIKAVYCHPAYLTYMQSTSWEMLGWMTHKLESRLPGEISITSDMQITCIISILKSRDITLLTKVHIVKAMDFPVVMYGYESWTMKKHWRIAWKALKNWYFWILVLEKALESPMDCKEIQPVNPKGNQPWIFIGRTAAEADAPIFWPPDPD